MVYDKHIVIFVFKIFRSECSKVKQFIGLISVHLNVCITEKTYAIWKGNEQLRNNFSLPVNYRWF